MASEEDSTRTLTCNGTPVDELRFADVKKELEDRGLSKAGSKTQLTDRLKAQLLLEKLQQDAAQSSGDEGKVPNIAIKEDKVGQNEFVRQYLQQQQRNLEIQMEAKKQFEDEKKRKSADESSADESLPNENANVTMAEPEITSPKKFKVSESNAQVAPAKESTRVTRPARKSSRNLSKAENGQESETVKDRSRSTTPEAESIRERTRSGSSSSERSPVVDKSRRGRRNTQRRGRSTRGGGRRTAAKTKDSSSPASSPEQQIMPKKRRRQPSISSRSRSRSPPPSVTSPTSTRRSGRKSSAAVRYTPDHGNEADEKKYESPVQRRRSRRKPSDVMVQDEPVVNKDGSSENFNIATDNKGKESMVKITEDINGGEKIKTPDSSNEETTVVNLDKGPKKEEKIINDLNRGDVENKEGPNKNVIKQKNKDVNSEDEQNKKDVKVNNEKRKSSNQTASEDAKDREVEAMEVDSSDRNTNVELVPSDIPINEEKTDGDGKKSGRLSRWKSRTKPNVKSQEDTLETISKPNEETKVSDLTKAVVKSPEQISEKENVEQPAATSEKAMKTLQEPVSSKTLDVVEEQNITSESRKRSLSPRENDARQRSVSSGASKSRSQSPPKKRDRSESSSSSSRSRQRARSSSSESSSGDESNRPKKRISTVSIVTKKDEKVKTSVDSIEVPKEEKEKVVVQEEKEPEKAITTCVDEIQPPVETMGEGKGKVSVEETKTMNDVKTVIDEGTSQKEKVDDAEPAVRKEKGSKRRKWGSQTSKSAKVIRKPSSIEISSDSLKGLIGEVKITETVFDMETEVVNTLDYDEQDDDRRDLKIKRTIIQDSPKTGDIEAEPIVVEDDARKVESSSPTNNAANQEEMEVGDDRLVETVEDITVNRPQVSEPVEAPKRVVKVTKDGAKKKGKDKEGKKIKKKKDDAAFIDKNKFEKADQADKQKPKVIATKRPSKPLIPQADEPELVSSTKAPARFPVSNVVRVVGLVRPFTLGQLKELMKRTGDIDEKLFWINSIKSECLVTYLNEEDAVKTREALHNTRWPSSNPKILGVDFATVEEVKHRQGGGTGPIPVSRPPQKDEPVRHDDKERRLKDRREKDREERDKGRDERVKIRDERDKSREERDKVRDERDRGRDDRENMREERDRRDSDRQKRREPERKIPVREWDRDKIQQFSKSRSRSRDRQKERVRRSRDRDLEKEDRKRRDRSRDDEKKKEKEKKAKAEEEPPAKLLDDLFRKTKATPCIYWLPLTEEQAQLRQSQREEREKERQKRLAAIEERKKEEEKKREAARQERIREREKEREKEKNRERERGRTNRDRSRSRSRSASRSRRRR